MAHNLPLLCRWGFHRWRNQHGMRHWHVECLRCGARETWLDWDDEWGYQPIIKGWEREGRKRMSKEIRMALVDQHDPDLEEILLPSGTTINVMMLASAIGRRIRDHFPVIGNEAYDGQERLTFEDETTAGEIALVIAPLIRNELDNIGPKPPRSFRVVKESK